MRFLAAIFLVLCLSACGSTKYVPTPVEIKPPEILMRKPEPLSVINPLNVIQGSQIPPKDK